MTTYDWSQDGRILCWDGLISSAPTDTRFAQACNLARHAFTIVLNDVVCTRGTDGLASTPLLIVASSARNAALLEHETGSAVVLHRGLVEAFDAVAQQALDNPRFLAEYLPSSDADGRREYAHHLFLHIVDFVLHHELAHELRGHLDQLEPCDGGKQLDELRALDECAAGNMLFQSLEFDADLHALDLQLGSLNARRPLREWPQSELEDTLFLQLLSAILCFQALDWHHSPVARSAGATHPAPVHRAVLYTEIAVESLISMRPRDRAWLAALHDVAWHEASIVAEASGMPTGRWHGTDMADAPDL